MSSLFDTEVSKLLKLNLINEQSLSFVGAGAGNWSSFDTITKKIFRDCAMFVLGDIITEAYGYKINMHLFWSVVICNFISGFIFFTSN
jgi:hypothetical protein